ncbi:GATA transcription factor 26 [Triticum urartu]|uniref:GATA transcription factor 26 n=1 Tax=Triticum urartu TaxID=4572 RepID=M7ZZP8_TRIUA|nr:GATA transcription factor 26 [Triticum urartu]
MAKKEGPCGHCGVTNLCFDSACCLLDERFSGTSFVLYFLLLMANAADTGTPLWRNGPPDKPVLCNACGSRWRIRGTLVNYTPAHRREDTGASEARPDKLKLKGQKQPKKRPNRNIVKDEPWSDQNFWKMGNADTSNRSGSGSAVSYSESCAPYGSIDASEIAGSASFIAHSEIKGASNSNAASEKLKWSPMQTHDSARRDELHCSNQHILESADSALVSVALEDNCSKEVGGLTKSSMRSLERPYESQSQSFTDAEVRGGAMRIASSRSRAMASSCQLTRRAFLPKSGNATGASLNLFMLAPDKLSSMLNPSDKDSDQDSLLLEVPRNARHPEAELLLCCPPPSQLSSVTVTAASPPSNHSPGSVSDQLRNRHQW